MRNEVWYIQHYLERELIAEHQLTLDDAAPDINNQARSFFYFRQRERELRSRVLKAYPKQSCHVRLADDPLLRFELERRTREIPLTKHTNVWKLYEALRYDYKRRRYLRPDETHE